MSQPERDATRYPPIEDYALLSDCASCALVSRAGGIDWCCMPTMDADPCFGRLLDWDTAGHCLLAPTGAGLQVERDYEPGSLVLRTTFQTPRGRAELHDFFVMPQDGELLAQRLARRLQCVQGEVDVAVAVDPRFDFGEILPALHWHEGAEGRGVHTACGSNKGLMIACDVPLQPLAGGGGLAGSAVLHQGQAVRLSMRFVRPEHLEALAASDPEQAEAVDGWLEQTLAWWRRWEAGVGCPWPLDRQTRRSAFVLKGLTFDATGAMAAAATTSLPESLQGERNWDYRFSWVRDTALAVRALHRLGFEQEADRFNSFTERSAAGSAAQLQIMYGLDGRRRLSEIVLPGLEGYRGVRPVRVGNLAADQAQHDIYGSLLEVAAVWHAEHRPIDAAYWSFLVDVVDTTCERWQREDYGIWEFRDRPRHFVHSKVMCWVALDRGIMLAQAQGLPAPLSRWREVREAIRADIHARGWDEAQGSFLQAYGEPHLDAAVLLLPHFGFIAADDPRMLRTIARLRAVLERDGLLLRYCRDDGLDEPEGAFLPCTFWLAECLALAGLMGEAKACYDRALACANDVGLFAEEYDLQGKHLLGNFPQALTHLAQITAQLALQDALANAG